MTFIRRMPFEYFASSYVESSSVWTRVPARITFALENNMCITKFPSTQKKVRLANCLRVALPFTSAMSAFDYRQCGWVSLTYSPRRWASTSQLYSAASRGIAESESIFSLVYGLKHALCHFQSRSLSFPLTLGQLSIHHTPLR